MALQSREHVDKVLQINITKDMENSSHLSCFIIKTLKCYKLPRVASQSSTMNRRAIIWSREIAMLRKNENRMPHWKNLVQWKALSSECGIMCCSNGHMTELLAGSPGPQINLICNEVLKRLLSLIAHTMGPFLGVLIITVVGNWLWWVYSIGQCTSH